jgi:hypothetical protein
MAHNYTRQRQGRDFPSPADEVVKADKQKTEFLERLQRFQKESAHQCDTNAVPIDGKEPDGIRPEKVR